MVIKVPSDATETLNLLRTMSGYEQLAEAIGAAQAEGDKALLQILLLEVAVCGTADALKSKHKEFAEHVDRAKSLAAAASACFRETRNEAEAVRMLDQGLTLVFRTQSTLPRPKLTPEQTAERMRITVNYGLQLYRSNLAHTVEGTSAHHALSQVVEAFATAQALDFSPAGFAAIEQAFKGINERVERYRALAPEARVEQFPSVALN